MKRVVSWIVVLAVVFALSVVLFVTGKQHKVMLINGEEGVKVPARVTYIVDNQDTDRPKSVRANRRGVAYVKGINHVIVIKYKEGGQDKEITKNFKAKIGKEATIDFAGMINGADNWITYQDAKPEAAPAE